MDLEQAYYKLAGVRTRFEQMERQMHECREMLVRAKEIINHYRNHIKDGYEVREIPDTPFEVLFRADERDRNNPEYEAILLRGVNLEDYVPEQVKLAALEVVRDYIDSLKF